MLNYGLPESRLFFYFVDLYDFFVYQKADFVVYMLTYMIAHFWTWVPRICWGYLYSSLYQHSHFLRTSTSHYLFLFCQQQINAIIAASMSLKNSQKFKKLMEVSRIANYESSMLKKFCFRLLIVWWRWC